MKKVGKSEKFEEDKFKRHFLVGPSVGELLSKQIQHSHRGSYLGEKKN